MLYYFSIYLLDWAKSTGWEDTLSPLRVFRYITFRAAAAAITALLVSWCLGPKIIRMLKELKFGQHYLDKAEEGGDLKIRLLSKKEPPPWVAFSLFSPWISLPCFGLSSMKW